MCISAKASFRFRFALTFSLISKLEALKVVTSVNFNKNVVSLKAIISEILRDFVAQYFTFVVQICDHLKLRLSRPTGNGKRILNFY